ncbi:MAG: peptidylprolyl isomerase [Candidatus Micrarchaeales archaeon]|nr:peptidylprolyl isomerase [Candidatus Micrarchaeales archaeon]
MAAEAKRKEGGFKPAYAVAIAITAIAIIGLVYMTTNSGAASGPVVAVGDNISVYYTGTYTNGTVFDSNAGKTPLNFTVGSGQLIKGFDDAVIGMKLNETKTVTIPANEAYGEVNQSLIVTVPKRDFGNQTVTVGMMISTSRGAQGRVTAVNATNVTVDFNSPLAGQTLVFKITVVSIKK